MKKIMITLCTLLALNAGFTMYAPELVKVEPGKSETGNKKSTQHETGRTDASKDVQENAANQSKKSSNESKGGKENKSADANGKTKKDDGSIDLSSSSDTSTTSGEKSYTTQLDPHGNVNDPSFIKSVADVFNLDSRPGDSVTFDTSGKETVFTLKRKDGTSYSAKVDESGNVLDTTKKSLTRSYNRLVAKEYHGIPVEEYNATYDPANYDREGNPTAEYEEAQQQKKIQAERNSKAVPDEIKTNQIQEENGVNSTIDSASVKDSTAKSAPETAVETAERLEKNPTQIEPFVDQVSPKNATAEQKATVVEWLTSELSKGFEIFTKAIADFLQDTMGTISRLTSNPVVVTSPEMRANQEPTGSAYENYGNEPLSASVSQSSQDNLFTQTSTGSLKSEDIKRPSTPIQSTNGALKPIGKYTMPGQK